MNKPASHLERSPLIHSYGYASAGNRPTCLANLPLKSKSFMQYASSLYVLIYRANNKKGRWWLISGLRKKEKVLSSFYKVQQAADHGAIQAAHACVESGRGVLLSSWGDAHAFRCACQIICGRSDMISQLLQVFAWLGNLPMSEV